MIFLICWNFYKFVKYIIDNYFRDVGSRKIRYKYNHNLVQPRVRLLWFKCLNSFNVCSFSCKKNVNFTESQKVMAKWHRHWNQWKSKQILPHPGITQVYWDVHITIQLPSIISIPNQYLKKEGSTDLHKFPSKKHDKTS